MFLDKSGENNPMYGKKHSLKTRGKIAASRMGRVQNNVKKQVLELTSMMLFDSVEEAAKHYGVTSSTMSVLVRDEIIKRGKCKIKDLYMFRIVELLIDEGSLQAGIQAISVVESPAIEEDFVALKEEARVELKTIDKEKRILMGAALIPNKPIYRKKRRG